MNEGFDLQAYLSKGIEDFMRDLVRATLVNPRESAFMLKFAAATAAASKKRKAAEAAGQTQGLVYPVWWNQVNH